MGWWAVYSRELFLMRKKIGNLGYFFSTLLFPLIYLFAFSWGFGANAGVAGGYIPFLAKGMIAVTVMLNSFQQTAISTSIGRFYFKSFQTLLVSPISAFDITFGMTLAGVTRGFIAGTMIYFVAAIAFSVPELSFVGVLGIFISSLCFGVAGFAIGLWADNQDALSIVTNFVITPMTFFCGSFFPIERLPIWLQGIVSWLPLSISTKLMRTQSWSHDTGINIMILLITAVLLFYIGMYKVKNYSE